MDHENRYSAIEDFESLRWELPEVVVGDGADARHVGCFSRAAFGTASHRTVTSSLKTVAMFTCPASVSTALLHISSGQRTLTNSFSVGSANTVFWNG